MQLLFKANFDAGGAGMGCFFAAYKTVGLCDYLLPENLYITFTP